LQPGFFPKAKREKAYRFAQAYWNIDQASKKDRISCSGEAHLTRIISEASYVLRQGARGEGNLVSIPNPDKLEPERKGGEP
jgi:hypothetical protein